jgi:hypothetical protein
MPGADPDKASTSNCLPGFPFLHHPGEKASCRHCFALALTNTNLYCDPPECLPRSCPADSQWLSDRHNRPSDGHTDQQLSYDDHGTFYTDCILFDECNDIYNYTPSSGSETFVDRDWVSPTIAKDSSSDFVDPNCLARSEAPVLASETPGLPVLGIDYEEAFPANFFMNPFSVSFPGDLDISWDYGLTTDQSHLPDDNEAHHGSVEGLRHRRQFSTHRDMSGMPSTSASYPGSYASSTSISHLNRLAGISSHSRTGLTPQSTSPLINVTVPSPSPTFPYNDASLHRAHVQHDADIGNTPAAPSAATSPSSSKSITSRGGDNNKPSEGAFQFVDASDRKTIVRLRNTMVSRKHRDNKVQRIKELERMLEERDKEIAELRKAAGTQGVSNSKGKAKGD